MGNDGCIYFLPKSSGYHILKLDPNNGDSLSRVGESIHEGIFAAVLGNYGYIYGISCNRIIKLSPTDYKVSCVGSEFEEEHSWIGAVLTEDGNIYSLNEYGEILRIDTTKNDWMMIEGNIYNRSETCPVLYVMDDESVYSWGRPVLGADKCIYFPPAWHDRVLKFNPSTQNVSLIGESYSENILKWGRGVLASNGYIYCIPSDADNILQIDSRHVNEQVVAMIENLNIIEK